MPREIDALIAAELKEVSPIRALAQVVQVGTSGYRKLVTTGGVASGWVGETSARPETATPDFFEIAPPSGELYANPAASQAMLDDAAFDLEGWLASEIAMEFARAEGAAFVGGNGVNQPRGFLSAPTSLAGDAARAFGSLQYIGSGDAAGFDANPESRLIDLVHTLKAGHRQGASWVMNSATLSEVRKLKTADGAFLWQPGMVEGQPDRLLGYPVVEAEDMPDVAGGAFPIAFGNFRAGYIIAERSATQILRDPFTNKPFVHFYATKRVGGQVLDSAAIKLLKIEAKHFSPPLQGRGRSGEAAEGVGSVKLAQRWRTDPTPTPPLKGRGLSLPPATEVIPMNRTILTPPVLAPEALDELKAWLAITTPRDDAALFALLRAALDTCEGFTGQMPLEAIAEEVLPATRGWHSLATAPVRAMTLLEALAQDGTRSALDPAHYLFDIAADGCGQVNLIGPVSESRVVVRFSAGIAPDWVSLPDGLRHGVIRLSAHHYRERNDGGNWNAARPLPSRRCGSRGDGCG